MKSRTERQKTSVKLQETTKLRGQRRVTQCKWHLPGGKPDHCWPKWQRSKIRGAEILKPGKKGLQCGRYCRSLRTLIHRGKYGCVTNSLSATICSNEAYILCTTDCMVGKFLQHNRFRMWWISK